jgi:hypothetical protein
MAPTLSTLTAALGLLASVALAKEKPVDEVKAAKLYDSGVIHEEIMEAKMVSLLLPNSLVPY